LAEWSGRIGRVRCFIKTKPKRKKKGMTKNKVTGSRGYGVNEYEE